MLQLRANLDKNCELRDRVVTGEVPANGLVNMSVDELATREKQKERERQRQEKFEEMQSDWLVKNDMKIRAKIGIGSEGMFKVLRRSPCQPPPWLLPSDARTRRLPARPFSARGAGRSARTWTRNRRAPQMSP